MIPKEDKARAPMNRSITLTDIELDLYRSKLLKLSGASTLPQIVNTTIHQDIMQIMDWLPSQSVDLLFVDPPYNLTKSFGENTFKERSILEYKRWLESWLVPIKRVLKPTASIYICGDWRSSTAIHLVTAELFVIRNRITWEREKGRGSKANWKNCSEDIWFGTISDRYFFDVDAVKMKRRVIAPYRNSEGKPKDWIEDDELNHRLTHPSNLWTDLTVPFWSMSENTTHPTQKPEKLLAKVILASSRPGDVILDPFLGSGTTSVVAKKLHRSYIGIEMDETYCCLAEKRLALAESDQSIQGYASGVFWERNSLQKPGAAATTQAVQTKFLSLERMPDEDP